MLAPKTRLINPRMPTVVHALMTWRFQVWIGEKGTLERRIGVSFARMSVVAMSAGNVATSCCCWVWLCLCFWRLGKWDNVRVVRVVMRHVKGEVGGVAVRADRGAPGSLFLFFPSLSLL